MAWENIRNEINYLERNMDKLTTGFAGKVKLVLGDVDALKRTRDLENYLSENYGRVGINVEGIVPVVDSMLMVSYEMYLSVGKKLEGVAR